MAKKVIKIIILIFSLFFIFLGLIKADYLYIFKNAALLCLSCIGIQ